MTRNRPRPAVLIRKVLLPPVLAGAAIVCLLAAIAVAVANGSHPRAGNPLGGSGSGGALASANTSRSQIVVALSADVEGTPAARDIRRARKPLPERLRLLNRHPYYRLYVRAQRRYHVPWVLVAAVHYQETGFERRADQTRRVLAIAAQLRAAHASRSLGERAGRAVARRYGATPAGRVSTAMVVERARAWRLLGALPARGRGELATPVVGVVGGCGYFGCPRPGHLHNGVDFLAPYGVPIHAADAGQVAFVQGPGASGGYGNFVCLQHRPHLATCYAHLGAVAVGVVQDAHVRRGQVIGVVGSTGSSTAPHLHFEARAGPAECYGCAVDPLALLSGIVPESRIPRMLRASANATGPVRAIPAEPPRPVQVAAAPRAPAPPIAAPAPAPVTGGGRPAASDATTTPARRAHRARSTTPTGGASVSAAPTTSPPTASTAPTAPPTAAAPPGAAAGSSQGGARPTAGPATSTPSPAGTPRAAAHAHPPG